MTAERGVISILPGDDDRLLTLAQAIEIFYPDGPLTIASLRTEIKKGGLTAERIAGKIFVTPRGLTEMRIKCREQPNRHGSTSGNGRAGNLNGLSSTQEAMNKAQAAAQVKNEERKRRLKDTSPASTKAPSEPTNLLRFRSQTS